MKEFLTPEFSLMMSWFVTLFVLSFLRAIFFTKDGLLRRAVIDVLLCGVWICGLVLSYPSCILVAPFALAGFIVFRKSLPKRSVILFLLPVLVIGGGYVAYLFSYMTMPEILERAGDVLDACGSHEFNSFDRFRTYGIELLIMLGLSAAAYALSCAGLILFHAIRGKKGLPEFGNTILISVIIGLVVQNVIVFLPYFDSHLTYSYDHFYFFLILFGGIVSLIRSRKALDEKEKVLAFGLLISLVGYIAVLILTNLTIFTSIRYLTIALATCLYFLMKSEGEETKDSSPASVRLILALALLMNFYNAVYYSSNNGYIWNVSKIGTIVKYGAGKGVLTEYMVGYIENSTNEEWEQIIEDGDVVLIWDESSLYYLNKDVSVGSYTTISTPTYTVDSIRKFWKLNPDRVPNVIAVSCWYGDIHLEGDYSEFYDWIETEYGADEVTDGKYYRYFIRRNNGTAR